MFNEIKKDKKNPLFMNVADSSAVCKGKGFINDLKMKGRYL